jgi:hypothetical protein
VTLHLHRATPIPRSSVGEALLLRKPFRPSELAAAMRSALDA